MLVQKRNGTTEEYDVEKIHKVLGWATKDISGVSLSDLAMNSQLQVHDKIPTETIHKIMIRSAADMIHEDTPNYQYVAARLLMYELRRSVWGSHEPPRLYEHIKACVDAKVYDAEILDHYSESEIHKIGRKIRHDRDEAFTYAGLQSLIDKYLIKNPATGKIYETPQFAYMMIAMWSFARYPKATRYQYVMKAYNHFSKHRINLPTPIMCGVRTPVRQYSSCVLAETGDSMKSIFSTATALGYYTAQRAGIGLHAGNIRALGSEIRSGEVVHTGIIPFLKVMESTVKSCSQNGVRGGSANCNVPFFHYEIEDIMTLKDNAKPDDVSVRKLDYTIAFSKLFYERFIANEDVTLFSPHEVKDMVEAFGSPEFDDLYRKYEKSSKIKMKKTVPARRIAEIFTTESIETGRIYWMNIDHANSHSAWKLPVKMTNLCCEITHPTVPLEHIDDDAAEIGVCILSAVNMLATKIDDLPDVCDTIVRILDELIDLQEYPVKAAENFCKKRRSLGVGVSNLAAYLASKKAKYGDADSLQLVDEYFEHLQYNLLNASCGLAKEVGPCEKFEDTTYSDGLLPIDHYCKSVDTLIEPVFRCDWNGLREKIKEHGLRHSTVSAIMPVESSSVIQNSTNGIEPPRQLLSYKKAKKGALPQLVPNFSRYKNYYTLAWEMKDNKGLIDVCAVIQKWIDMAISANVYYNYSDYDGNQLPMSVVIKDMLYAYKMGQKTRYYLNTNDGDTSVDLNTTQATNPSNDAGCESGACAI